MFNIGRTQQKSLFFFYEKEINAIFKIKKVTENETEETID